MQILATNALIALTVILAVIFTGNALALVGLLWLQSAPPPAYLIQRPSHDTDARGPIGFVDTDDNDDDD